MSPKLLDLCAGEGGASVGFQRAGFHVTAVDTNGGALDLNPAEVTVQADALEFLEKHGYEFDVIHASFPCQRWAANGANPASSKWPDLITPGRDLLQSVGKPWTMENTPKSPLRPTAILCGTQFSLTAIDDDGTLLYLKRHRYFESNVTITAPSCKHEPWVQWAGVYGGARSDKAEARYIRKGGYVPPNPLVQSALLGGVDWMSAKGRKECVPPIYAEHIGRQLMAYVA